MKTRLLIASLAMLARPSSKVFEITYKPHPIDELEITTAPTNGPQPNTKKGKARRWDRR